MRSRRHIRAKVRFPNRGDKGYVMAMSALLLLPLLAFTGLAVDLGGWYSRAAAIQRTTDAASLAGVALLPLSEAQAIQRAEEVAAQNGFVDGVDGIEVDAVPIGIDQVQVRITDTKVPQYFTSMFRDDVKVSRQSIAEYIPPVRMGSPRNFLGTGQLGQISPDPLPGGAVNENFTLSINSPCAWLEDGDIRASRNMGYNSSSNHCNPATGAPNPDYDARGYIYGVKVEEGYSAGPIDVQVYDAALCSGNIDLTLSGWNDDFDTRFTLRAPAPNPYNGAFVSQITASDCGYYRGEWRTIGTITSPQPGDIYSVQVESLNPVNNRRGSANNFALRARTGGSWQACSGEEFEADPALATADWQNCPNVFAFEDLSIFANVGSGQAEFFLASIGPEHSGKTLIVELFDPGEGGRTIELLDPEGNAVTFERSIRQRWPGEATPGGGWGPFTENIVDIYRDGPPPGSYRNTDTRCGGVRCLYNERSLRLEVQLPADIDAEYSGLTWWKVRYVFGGGGVTDRTTWSVTVRGDPVRLIE